VWLNFTCHRPFSSSILSTSWILSFPFIKFHPCGIAHLCLSICSICVKVLWNSIHVVKVLWNSIIDRVTTISVVNFYPWTNICFHPSSSLSVCRTTCVIKFHEHKVIHRWYKIALVLNLILQYIVLLMLCFIHLWTVLVNLIHEQSSSNLYGDLVVAIYFSWGQIWANDLHAQTLKEIKLNFLP